MPSIGERSDGKDIGKVNSVYYNWFACPECGKERWVRETFVKENKHTRCRHCCSTKINNPNWKGGYIRTSEGYIGVRVPSDDFFSGMSDQKGYILEHRLVMAKYLGRCLLRWEVIHHKNGIKDDNRIENLQLLPSGRYHLVDTLMKSRIALLEKQVKEQAEMIKLLQWHIKEINKGMSREGQLRQDFGDEIVDNYIKANQDKLGGK